MNDDVINKTIEEARDSIGKAVELLTKLSGVINLREREKMISEKEKQVAVLISKKQDLEEREKDLRQRELVQDKKDKEQRGKQLLLDRREEQLLEKTKQINNILGS